MKSNDTREKVFLKKINKDVLVGHFSVADDIWCDEMFGEDKIREALTSFDADVILAIFWRVLERDSKKLISRVEIFDYEGLEEKKLEFSDPIDKLKNIVCGADELMSIWQAIINMKNKSILAPTIDEVAKAREGRVLSQAEVIDLFSSEYGYSREEVLAMTPRRQKELIDAMYARKSGQSQQKDTKVNLTPEQEKLVSNMMGQAMAEGFKG